MTSQTIDDETKRKILKSYLGFFYGKVSNQEIAEFRKQLPTQSSAICTNTPTTLRKLGFYYLMAWGKVSYRFLYTYNLIDFYLKTPVEGEEEQVFYDVHTPVLILYHMANTMENRQLKNLTCHTLNVRQLAGKKTLLLCETTLPQARSWFTTSKLPQIEAKASVSSLTPKPRGTEL